MCVREREEEREGATNLLESAREQVALEGAFGKRFLNARRRQARYLCLQLPYLLQTHTLVVNMSTLSRLLLLLLLLLLLDDLATWV